MNTISPEPYKFLSFGEGAARHVSMCTVPIAYGYGTSKEDYTFHSATATLADLGDGPLVITCQHVIRKRHEIMSQHKDKPIAQLFIGNFLINREPEIITCDEGLDIATFKLTAHEIKQIANSLDVQERRPIKKIFKGQITFGDIVSFSGYPADPSCRYKEKAGLYAFHPFSFIGAEVTSVNDDYLICKVDLISRWSRLDNLPIIMNDPGGISGGPVFLHKLDVNPYAPQQFIGIIKEGVFMTSDCLVLYIYRAKRFNADGTISNQ